MNASIDIDLLAHLGEFKNVDLLQRGKYCVQVGLFYGEQKIKIIPVGIFSAPSSINSFVGEQRISDLDHMTCCEVDEVENVFRSRQLIVRYKGERHELNEGVNWRLTLMNVDIRNAMKNKSVIRCKQLLYIEFSLLFCALKEDAVAGASEEEWKPVANQTLCLQQVGSDLHHYFPVSFSGMYNTQVDCMVFGMITGITYNQLNPKILSWLQPSSNNNTPNTSISASQNPKHSQLTEAEEGEADHRRPHSITRQRSSSADEVPTTHLTPETHPDKTEILNHTIARITTTIEQTSHHVNSNFQTIKRLFSPLKSIPPKPKHQQDQPHQLTSNSSRYPPSSPVHTLFRSKKPQEGSEKETMKRRPLTATNSVDASSTHHLDALMNDMFVNPISGNNTTLSKEQACALLECYFLPVSINDGQVITSCQFVLHMYEEWKIKYNASFLINSPKHIPTKGIDIGGGEKGGRPGLTKDRQLPHFAKFTSTSEVDTTPAVPEAFVTQLLQPNIYSTYKQQLSQKTLSGLVTNCIATTTSLLSSSSSSTSATTSSLPSSGGGDAEERIEITQLFALLQTQTQLQNKQLTMKWSLLLNTLRMIMSHVKESLHTLYTIEMNIFWKQQQMIHTRSIEGAYRMSSHKDQEILDMLLQHIAYERVQDKQLLTSVAIAAASTNSSTHTDLTLMDTNLTSTLVSSSSLASSSYIPQSSLDITQLYARGLTVFDKQVHMFPTKLPYLFVEKYIAAPSSRHNSNAERVLPSLPLESPSKPFDGVHVIILQHGFLGNSLDMRYLTQALTILCPESSTMIYSAHDNSESSQETIASMAKKLAKEVIEYLTERCPSMLDEGISSQQCRISFIGHSLGGVIIRAALTEPEMKPLLSKLHIYMSLASPHLGNLFSESQLVSTGMWALLKFKNCVCLKELTFDDHPNPKDSYLFRLAQLPAARKLALFHRVILISSPKDQYVPFYSARMQITNKMESDSTHSKNIFITEMAERLLESLSANQLIRMTMVNDVEETSLLDMNAVIGRTAHIGYLDNPVLAYQVIQSTIQYFLGEE